MATARQEGPGNHEAEGDHAAMRRRRFWSPRHYPLEAVPSGLKHAICIETVTDPASAHYGFTLYVQRKKAA